MGALLGIVGRVGVVVGVISLIRPIQRLRITTRKQAGIVTAASFVLLLVGTSERFAELCASHGCLSRWAAPECAGTTPPPNHSWPR